MVVQVIPLHATIIFQSGKVCSSTLSTVLVALRTNTKGILNFLHCLISSVMLPKNCRLSGKPLGGKSSHMLLELETNDWSLMTSTRSPNDCHCTVSLPAISAHSNCDLAVLNTLIVLLVRVLGWPAPLGASAVCGVHCEGFDRLPSGSGELEDS